MLIKEDINATLINQGKIIIAALTRNSKNITTFLATKNGKNTTEIGISILAIVFYTE